MSCSELSNIIPTESTRFMWIPTPQDSLPRHGPYTSSGQVTTVQNAKSEVTTYSYGDGSDPNVPAGYLASIQSPDFNGSHAETRFEYDAAHRIRTVQNDPDAYRVTTDYDNIDRPTQITYPDGSTQSFDYTQDFGSGSTTILDLTTSTDRDGRPTVRHYNRNHQMDSITDPLGQMTSYDWCTCGSLVGITDPNGNLTIFNRDTQKRITSKVFADHSAIAYTYENTTSRLKSILDANGQSTNYQYYPDDNLKQVSYGNALHSTPTVGYAYDSNYSRLTSMTDGIGTTTYSYYPVASGTLGAGKVHQIDGPFSNDTITYTYDELGRRIGDAVSDDPTTRSVQYDSLGRIAITSNAIGSFARSCHKWRDYYWSLRRSEFEQSVSRPSVRAERIAPDYDSVRQHVFNRRRCELLQ